MSQIDWRNKVVLTPDDPGFPGKNMYDAAAVLERRYKKTLLFINSGSGFSDAHVIRCSRCILPENYMYLAPYRILRHIKGGRFRTVFQVS